MVYASRVIGPAWRITDMRTLPTLSMKGVQDPFPGGLSKQGARKNSIYIKHVLREPLDVCLTFSYVCADKQRTFHAVFAMIVQILGRKHGRVNEYSFSRNAHGQAEAKGVRQNRGIHKNRALPFVLVSLHVCTYAST